MRRARRSSRILVLVIARATSCTCQPNWWHQFVSAWNLEQTSRRWRSRAGSSSPSRTRAPSTSGRRPGRRDPRTAPAPSLMGRARARTSEPLREPRRLHASAWRRAESSRTREPGSGRWTRGGRRRARRTRHHVEGVVDGARTTATRRRSSRSTSRPGGLIPRRGDWLPGTAWDLSDLAPLSVAGRRAAPEDATFTRFGG